MKPILFTLIVAVGVLIAFVGNYNGDTHNKRRNGNGSNIDKPGDWLKSTRRIARF
jgi:hypothetical protein